MSTLPLLTLHDLSRTAIKVGPAYIKRKHPQERNTIGANYSAFLYKALGLVGCSALQGKLCCLNNLLLSFFLYG